MSNVKVSNEEVRRLAELQRKAKAARAVALIAAAPKR